MQPYPNNSYYGQRPFEQNWGGQQVPMPGYAQMPQPSIQQYQNPMPQTRPVTGRYIGSPTEIQANEVPMDGRIGFFPTNDMGAIFAKQWCSDGSIQTVKYVPEHPVDQVDSQPNYFEEILSRLSTIEEKLGTRKTTTAKKEEAKNE